MRIERLGLSAKEALLRLAEGYPYKPYWFLQAVSEENRTALFHRELMELLANNDAVVLGAWEDDILLGASLIKKLSWDCEHFGFDVARLDYLMVSRKAKPLMAQELLVEASIDAARELGIKSIQTWLTLDEIKTIQVLETLGFYTTDTSVTYVFDVEKQPIRDYEGPLKVRDWQDSDQDVLLDLARTAFWQDRFHADPHLDKGKSDELHLKWLRNSFSGQVADHVIVAEKDGIPVGFLTCKLYGDCDGILNTKIGVLVLAAVSPTARGTGCYTAMIYEGFRWFKDGAKARWVLGGTQVHNFGVQRMWSKAGSRLVRAGTSLHAWLD
jgi:hypothetical protein